MVTFELDDRRAVSNERKHGVNFFEAASVIDDPFAMSVVDALHTTIEEERWIIIGQSSAGRLNREFDTTASSELLRIECRRVLHRYRMDGSITDGQLQEATVCLGQLYGLTILEINREVKRRASEAFPTVLGTLDAIHLSTAVWANLDAEPLVVFTFDNQMHICAQAMGIHTI